MVMGRGVRKFFPEFKKKHWLSPFFAGHLDFTTNLLKLVGKDNVQCE